MIPLRLDVDGVPEARRRLERLGVDVRDVRPAARAVAIQAAIVARTLAPHRTGRLSGSIRAGVGRNYSSVAAGSRSVPYAGVINRGWRRRNIRASRFMERTGDVMRGRMAHVYETHLRRIIKERGLS